MKKLGNRSKFEITSMYIAKFTYGQVEPKILAYQRADVSIMPSSVLEQIRKQDSSVKVQELSRPLLYSTLDEEARPLIGNRSVIATITLNVWHATQLVIRGVTWFISNNWMNHAIMGSDLIAIIGLDNRSLMVTACYRLEVDIDV